MFKKIWIFRHFIWSSVKTEFKLRHSRSKLGLFWMFIHPLFQAALYIVVLSGVMSEKMASLNGKSNYALYLLSGTVAWSLFSEIVNRSVNLFIENAQLLKKAAFPKISLPINVIIMAVFNNVLLFVIVIVLFILSFQIYPNCNYLFLIPLVVSNVLMAAGIGLIVGSINVFMRDIGQMVPLGMMVLYWSTPIVYRAEMLSKETQVLFKVNPLYYLVDSYHSILFLEASPKLESVITSSAGSLLLFVLGLLVFSKASPEMVDVL